MYARRYRVYHGRMTDKRGDGPVSGGDGRPPLGALSNALLLFGLFAAIFAFFSFFARNFFTVRSVLNLLVQTSTYSLVSIAALLVMIVGGMDFSLGAIVAICGSFAAGFARGGMPAWQAMACGIAIGGIMGLINGVLVAAAGLPPLITTYATAMFMGGFFPLVGSLIGGGGRYRGVPESFGALANDPVLKISARAADGSLAVVFPGLSWIVIIMGLMAILIHSVVSRTAFGRRLRLCGFNPAAARLSGVGVRRVKATAYALAGLLAGLVGILLASRMVGSPGAGRGYEIYGISCALIGGASISGGTGSVGRTVLGSFILATLSMGLTMMNANAFLQLIVTGAVVLGAVYIDVRRNSILPRPGAGRALPLNAESTPWPGR
jgi:ribose transport system permease protein